MAETLRTYVRLMERRGRRRWIGVMALAATVSALEALVAFLVYFLLNAITRPGEALVVPVVGDLRDRFPGTDDDTLFVAIAVVVGGFFLVRAAASVLQTYTQNRVSYNAGVDLSTRLLQGYLAMPYSWHLRRNSAELIRNAYESVTLVVSYVFLPLTSLAAEALVVVSITVVLLVTAPLATLLAAAVLGPLVFALLHVLQPRLHRYGSLHQDMSQRALHTLQQSLHGVRDVKLLAREEYFLDRFGHGRAAQARMNYLRSTAVELPRLTVETVVMVLTVTFLAVTRAWNGTSQSSLAVLGLFAYAVLRVMPALNRVVTHVNNLRFGRAAADQVVGDLDLFDAAAPAPAAPPGERLVLRESIRLEGVSFRYEGTAHDVLSGVDLSIGAGESIGIVGATGSGKSTLIDLVLGLIAPTEGVVTVDGVDIRGRETAWQLSLGVVPQAPFLLDDTIRRNVALGLADADIDDEAVHEAIVLAQLGDFVASLPAGLDTEVGERGVRLSGGQRQRVAIARALYRRPQVLVLDEGTSALDNATEHELIRALDRLRGERTLVTVAHRLSTVRVCDRVVLLRGGRIVDAGGVDELVGRNAELRELAR